MQYDVGSATITVTLFFAIFSAGKTCIYAFLTVYFRHLGISPFQAGILRGIQALVGGISIPSMIYCTGLCAHRRFMMITCIFLTMASYLILLVMSLPSYSCFVRIPSTCDNFTFLGGDANASLTSAVQNKRSTLSDNVFEKGPGTIIVYRNLTTNKTHMDVNPMTRQMLLSTEEWVPSSSTFPSNILDLDKDSTFNDPVEPTIPAKAQNKKPGKYLKDEDQSWYPVSDPLLRDRNNRDFPNEGKHRVRRTVKEKPETTDPSTKPIPEYLSIYQRIWPDLNASCFIMLVVILLVGEMVSSPIDNIASNTWFIYLDEIDYTESHRKHMNYIPMTTALVICVIGVVNVVQCSTVGEPFKAYHINFYMFGILLGIALVTTYFFPTPQRKNTPIYFYGQGLDILRYFCSSSASTILLTTVVVNGIFYACIHDFLLWYIEDLNGSQFATSSAVALAFFSDAIVKFLFKRMQKRLSTNGLVILGVAFYGVRFLLFTTILNPWMIVLTQALHCFSSCLFWKGIIVQVRKIYESKAEQQIVMVLHTFHYVLGYTIGAVVSGFLYNNYKPTVLFWAMGGLSLTWSCVLFLCFFAFDIKLQQKEIRLENSLDSEQMSLFSVSSDHEEE